jgi:hypothetical protein
VQAAFTLNVNHGGGYQYRMCPYSEGKAMTEDCFAQHPLKFADGSHTVRFADGSKDIQIPAVDVTEGVVPIGAAWRRIPIPSCNCDIGRSCNANSTASDDSKVYDVNSSSAFGDCRHGLQFEAKHLTDGSWPSGYGFYLGALNGGTGPSTTVKDECSTNDDQITCTQASGCAWYAEKSTCYTGKDTTKSSCGTSTDETACGKVVGCQWYGSGKNVCYASKSKRNLAVPGDSYGIGTTAVAHTWEIVDNLIAPMAKGDYILQWRWDNEQTPQIWTTCSDITVGEVGETIGGAGNLRLSSSMKTVVFIAVVVAVVF